MKSPTLGALEFTVLLSVARHVDEAYGAALRRDVSARAQRDYSIGAIYATLQRLEDKGFVRSRHSEPTPVRGGRARRCFVLTAAGRTALREGARRRQHLLEDLSLVWRLP
jgi:DNA-binding PadR family transcriptional regulator